MTSYFKFYFSTIKRPNTEDNVRKYSKFCCHLEKKVHLFTFYVFWGVDYESEIGLWRSASEICLFWFLIENNNGVVGPVGSLEF